MADISRLPSLVTDWDWQPLAACRGTDTTIFFHPTFERGATRDARVAAAKAICGRCPVLDRCREHALSVEEPYGTWGGLDQYERVALIRARRRQARTTPA